MDPILLGLLGAAAIGTTVYLVAKPSTTTTSTTASTATALTPAQLAVIAQVNAAAASGTTVAPATLIQAVTGAGFKTSQTALVWGALTPAGLVLLNNMIGVVNTTNTVSTAAGTGNLLPPVFGVGRPLAGRTGLGW